MLDSKRYAYDGYTKHQANKQMRYGKFPSKDDNPDDIKNQASRSKMAQFDSFAERPEDKVGDFKTLHSKGYADNGYAQNESC